MSEHTKGKLIAKYEWLVPEAHQDRPIGNSSNPIHDRDNYAQVVAQVRGRYHDQDANARRLAAVWNACEGMPTDDIEELAACQGVITLTVYADDMRENMDKANARIAYLESLVQQQDTWLGKRPCQNSRCNELNAARALLREVVDMVPSEEYNDTIRKADAYLDACDKPGEQNAS